MKHRYPIILCLLLLSFVIVARADEIKLSNGDRITGKIKETSEQTVTIETDYAGSLTIRRSAISSINSNNLTNAGITERQSVKSQTRKTNSESENNSVFSGPAFGLFAGWEGNGSVGFNYSSGNSNNSTLATGIRAVKKAGGETLSFYARSLWTSTRSRGRTSTIQNAYWGGIRFDQNIGSNLFSFISFDFERDRPKKLSFRSVPGAGIGRHILRKQHSEIDIIAGGAWNRTFQTGPNTDTPEILSGLNIKHKFTPRLKFQKSFTFYQNATDLNEYRFMLDATLNIDVTKRVGFYITAGDRFNNDPAGQSKKNDFLFTTGIKWSFGTKN